MGGDIAMKQVTLEFHPASEPPTPDYFVTLLIWTEDGYVYVGEYSDGIRGNAYRRDLVLRPEYRSEGCALKAKAWAYLPKAERCVI
jgi:hypothetical protein